MGKIQKVSIRDLSKVLGVSPMTVSRSLRNSPLVNSKTKAAVLALADEMGYVANPLVRANMATIRSNRSVAYQATIAVLHYTPAGGHWAITNNIIEAVKARAIESGFSCDFFDLADPEVARADLARIFKSRGIQGVIQTPMAPDFESFSFDFSGLTIVSCDPGLLPQKFHRVCPDYYGNMDMLLKRIHRDGHKRIGLFLAKDLDQRLNYLVSSRYLAFQQTEELPRIPIHMPITRNIYNAAAIRKWFDQNKPEIIINTADTNFRDDLFGKAGLRIPDDVAVVKVNINRKRDGISGISEESHDVGATAVNTLAQLLFQNQRGLPEKPISVLVPGRWID